MALSKGKASRQKMINLMYLVFIAMLALNIPAEVLDGFVLVNDKLQQTIQNTTVRNEQIYTELENSYKRNPEKTGPWYNKAQDVKTKTDSLFNYIQDLKVRITVKSDGKDGDVNNLKSKDNLSASSEIMVSPLSGQGEKLKKEIDSYREEIIALLQDEGKKDVVRNSLTTEPSKRAKDEGKDWVQASFEQMPSIASLAYLSEIQSSIKQAEGEALISFLKNIDITDYRVNELSAYVIPESNIVMRGTSYKANIVLAAVDTTQRPRIVIEGKELPKENNGLYQIPTGASGAHSFNGYIEMMNRDGSTSQRQFSQTYTVMEPMATVAPLLMDVLYAGYNNPISISVPGVPQGDVSASAEGGVLTSSGNGTWVAKPTKIGQKMTIVVSARLNGAQQVVARKEFRVRALPDPTPYIEYKDADGNPKMFKRGALARSILLNSGGLKAAIDDGILNIPFTVLSFRTVFVDVMGNASPELSNGGNFSERQLDQIRKMTRGKTFFIAGVKVKGPDGIEREISAIEVRVN
ncbi:MAG: gliding motility protein GldM [Dysgonomonas sp.]